MQILYWQNVNSAFRIVTSQKKAIRIINNQPRNSQSSLLFKKINILKFEGKILINNIIFISKSINNLLPPIFKNWFIPIFTTTTQSYLQLINYLSLHVELTTMEETQLL